METKSLVNITLILTLLFLANSSWGWTPKGETTKITELWHWQDNARSVFKTENGILCYIPDAEDKIYSFVLAMHLAQKEVIVHCHDETISHGGLTLHRVHRVYSKL